MQKRYGLKDKLPNDFIDEVFEDLDSERIDAWTWHDFRQLGGPAYHALKKRIQRRRIREQHQKFAKTHKGKDVEKKDEPNGIIAGVGAAWADATGKGADPAKV